MTLVLVFLKLLYLDIYTFFWKSFKKSIVLNCLLVNQIQARFCPSLKYRNFLRLSDKVFKNQTILKPYIFSSFWQKRTAYYVVSKNEK